MREVGGHDHAALLDVFAAVPFEPGRPSAVLARTVKGRGVSFIENDVRWHHRVPKPEELERAMAELEAEERRLGAEPEGRLVPSPPPRGGATGEPGLPMGRPNQDVFSETLLDLARADPSVVVVTSDSRGSGKLSPFAEALPGQIVEVGIAEQTLVGVAAGLASGGRKPFAVSPACFLTARSLEQIKNDVAYSRQPVRLVGISAGVSYGALGSTHHSTHDLAALRAIPGLTIVVPADNHEARAAALAAYASPGPIYVRIGKRPVPDLPGTAFELGRARLVRDGDDLAFLATGETVWAAHAAAERLAAERPPVSRPQRAHAAPARRRGGARGGPHGSHRHGRGAQRRGRPRRGLCRGPGRGRPVRAPAEDGPARRGDLPGIAGRDPRALRDQPRGPGRRRPRAPRGDPMSHVVAVDQSTSATKVVLFDEAGTVHARASRPHRQLYPRPGWVEHDAEEIYRNVVECLAEVARAAPEAVRGAPPA